jgi:hypothetical protein
MKPVLPFLLLALALVGPLPASIDDPEKNVVYVEEFSPDEIKLKVEKPGIVYATNKGGRSRGTLRTGTEVRLVSFTDRAYYIRGTRTDGLGVSGWVSPAAFSSKDPKFVEKLKEVHTRQLLVRELIEAGEVALGMTPEEVRQIYPEPTKTKVRRNAEGQTQVWEMIEYDEINHYAMVRDPVTGAFFRQLTHTTTEETSKVVVEFEDGFVTAIEQSKNNGPAQPTIVASPIIFAW